MKNGYSQEIKKIPIRDLVLWTENPRDPIDDKATDLDVLNRALSQEGKKKWKLDSLIKAMGKDYDYSELPTVVYHGDKPVVYDGNRRIIVGKIKLGLLTSKSVKGLNLEDIPTYPEIIPCNVCDEETALNHLLRKHGANGSWDALERDIFVNRYLNHAKTNFLLIDDYFGCVSDNDNMNKDYVKEEIFTDDNMKRMGFSVKNSKLFSKHSCADSKKIIDNIVSKVGKEITTRKHRGDIVGVLDEDIKKIISEDIYNEEKELDIKKTDEQYLLKTQAQRLNRRTYDNGQIIFGEKLSLKQGDVNNLYRDICDLYFYWLNYKDAKDSSKKLSPTFPSLIRMSLRLLVETAAKDTDTAWEIKDYIKEFFDSAKKDMTQEEKTSLSATCPGEVNSITKLLQIGAHNYSAANNMAQTLDLSVLIGKMLLISHGQIKKRT